MRRFELVRQGRTVARGQEFGYGSVALSWVGGPPEPEIWTSLGKMFDRYCADGRLAVRPEVPVSRDP